MRLGDILVNDGLITPEQLDKSMAIQKDHPNLPIGQILCQLGYLAKDDLNTTLHYYKKRLKIGDILVNSRLIDKRMLDHALTVSQRDKIPVGKALVNLRYVQEEQLCRAIAEQYDLSYLSLKGRTFSHDMSRFLNLRWPGLVRQPEG